MRIEDRHRQIVEQVRGAGRVLVTELAEHFDVTPETIRRDLAALDRSGVLRKVHGGAIPAPAPPETGVTQREQVNPTAKQAIARAALREAPAGSLAVFVTGDEDLAGKPSPEPYERAAGRLGVDPADCVVFEDSLFGVRSALAARTHAVVVPFMADIPPLPGLLRIDSLDGLDARALSRFAAQPLPAGDPLA